jgi:ATP-dependent helicase/nuclease subunit A
MSGAAHLMLDDAEARRRIREALDESLIVEASAGTGKTTELVRRIVNVLRAGHKVDSIVAVTFTNKAAGELKLRLRQELDRARSEEPDAAFRANLEDALAHLEEASIGTIHAFCGELLRERPVEAQVDPAFAEVAQSESDRLFREAFQSWIQARLNEESPGLRRALSRIAARENAESPIEQLAFAARKLIEWRDYPAAWQQLPFPREQAIDQLVDHLMLTAPRVNPAFRAIADLATRIERQEEFAPRDHDELESLFLKLLRDLKRLNRKGEEAFVHALEQFKRVADADLAYYLRDELIEVKDRYEERKARTGRLDFLDLLLCARNLVAGNRDVRAYLQRTISHIFVDEFQDTDPLQAEILLLLAADSLDQTDWLKIRPVPGKLFLVGDPKQSIYKFRRADVEMYQQLKRSLMEKGVGVVQLTKSFRSVRPIQQFVNAAFAPLMTGDEVAAQAQYAPLGEHWPAPEGRPSVIALPVPKPYGMRNVSKKEIERSLPDAICAHVEWLLSDECKWQVRDPEDPSRLTKITARHVCLLFRRFLNFGEDLTRDYVRGLEARGIPHLLVGSKSFHSREEVETVRAALNAIEWPDDELSVFATLRGSLFALEDERLYNFRHEYKRWFPFLPKPAEVPADFAPVWQALEELARLHRGRNRRAVADTVNQLLEATRAHAGFALRPAGDQVLANVYRIADLARSYELEGGISFRGFVELLDEQSKKAESAEAPVLEEGAEGVRIMTVHAAKGLEFPIVYLADITANLTAKEPDRYVDSVRKLCAQRLMGCTPFELLQHADAEQAKEKAEGVRVAYVAATRAKDLLVVPGVGTEELKESWVSPLHKALYPEPRNARRSQLAPGCPPFGETTVLNLPPEYPDDPSIRPGEFQLGEHHVTWWDPATLRLGVEPSVGLRQEEILAGGSPDSQRAYQAWRDQRSQALAKGGVATFQISTPTELTEAPDGFWINVPVVEVARASDRPKGPRFGTLVHAILHDVDLADPDVAGVAALHGRLTGADAAEVAAAAQAAGAALEHPLMQEAARTQRLHREYPVMLKLRHGFVEGKADLVFQNPDGWTLVDFKTDADLDPALSSYQTQLLWYAFAIHTLTKQPVRAFLLSV